MVNKVRKAMPKKKEEKAPRAKLSKFISKAKERTKQKRDNPYVFHGFFERLKNIDVKHAHSSLALQSQMLDHLQDDEYGESMFTAVGNDGNARDDLQTSNFIQMLRAEKFKTHTAEFNRIFRDLEPLCFSYPLLILNRPKVVQKLISYLDDPSLKSVQCIVLDLTIALIKDLRHEVFGDFMSLILPKTISVIDVHDLSLLDKIFQVLSFAFKYLIKPMKENVREVFSVYVELLQHRNRYIRKFSAQSFSYVVRKITFDTAFADYLLGFLAGEDEALVKDRVNGLAELFFEVITGHGDDLHSKGREILASLLVSEKLSTKGPSQQVVRVLALKLVNEIDIFKQEPIFEELATNLAKANEPYRLTLLFKVLNQSVALKFGKRIGQPTVIAICQILNTLVQKQQDKVKALPLETRKDLAETLGLLFYFKHANVMQIYEKSGLDFTTAKSALSSGVFALEDADSDCLVLQAFYSLPLKRADQITPKETYDLDVDKILHLKQSNQIVQFSAESHALKARILVKPLARHTLKLLSQDGVRRRRALAQMAIQIKLIEASRESLVLDLPEKAQAKIKSIIEQKGTELETFVIAKFIRGTKQFKELAPSLRLDTSPTSRVSLDTRAIVEGNIVLKAYRDALDRGRLEQNLRLVMDLQNYGYLGDIRKQTAILMGTNEATKLDNSSNILALKLFKMSKQDKKMSLESEEGQTLFLRLNENLSKNSVELRQQTLRVMARLFEPMSYLPWEPSEESTLDAETVSKHYTGPCNLISLLLEYENLTIGYDTERQREILLRQAEVMIGSKLVPSFYVDTLFHLMVGSLWLKYTPAHPPAMSLLQRILQLHTDQYLPMFLHLFDSIGHLMQFVTGDNQALEEFLSKHLSDSYISSATLEQASLLEQVYASDVVSQKSYMPLKDFHFNLCKTLFPIVDMCLSKPLPRDLLFGTISAFYENEHRFLNQGRSRKTADTASLQETMILANMVDSEEFRGLRKTAHSKLCSLVELMSKAQQLKQLEPSQTEKLVEYLMELLSTSEEALQKNTLACLVKCSKKNFKEFKNRTVKLGKYAKLLEGLADDILFKNMIPAIRHGSQASTALNTAYVEQDGQALDDAEPAEADKPTSKRQQKGAIPKLEKEDRLDVLPVIIKLLFAKINKKRGAINKQGSLGDRRTTIYIFLSSLEPETEFPLFLAELMTPLGLRDLADPSKDLTSAEIETALSRVSFSQSLALLATVETIFKQLGTLLSHHGFLTKLAKVLTVMLRLAKKFMGHLKEEDLETKQTQEDTDKGAHLFKFVGKQARECLRNGLRVAKLLFQRFRVFEDFVKAFSAILYEQVVQDQLPTLSSNLASHKSQLVELLSDTWSAGDHTLVNFTDYPDVIPSLLTMLEAPKLNADNLLYLLQMLRNILTRVSTTPLPTVDGEDVEMNDANTHQTQETATQIIRANIEKIASSLHKLWTSNESRLKQALSGKGNKLLAGQAQRDHTHTVQMLSMMTYVVSELAGYLSKDLAVHARGFLDMIVTLLGNKQILQASSSPSGLASGKASRNEQLLIQGCHGITSLVANLLASDKRDLLGDDIINKVFRMLLTMESKKAREALSTQLQSVLAPSSIFKAGILTAVKDINAIKTGLADLTLDFNRVLSAIEKVNAMIQEGASLTDLEVNVLFYNMLHLLRNPEYSVRDFASHSVSLLLPKISENVFKSSESWLMQQTKVIREELVLKTILTTFKQFIGQATSAKIEGTVVGDLEPLMVSQEDFFGDILSMQIGTRSKALRKLASSQSQIPAGSFRRAILPIVDYLIFDTKNHMQNRRNTVRYSKEQSSQLLEDALKVYVEYSRRLSWSETFKLIRKLLYSIEKAQRNSMQYSAEKEDAEAEKVMTKCLCKVLEGMSLNDSLGLPDAVAEVSEKAKGAKERKNEFSSLLEELVGKAKPDAAFDGDEQDSSDGEDDKPQETMDIIQVDKQMREEGVELKRKIQIKLQRKVLPVLQRHLHDSDPKKQSTKDSNASIRSFVAVAIAKVIRKLPLPFFRSQLQKLINSIVVKGLRSTNLQTREKARKALIRVIGEVSPRFLQLIFNEMYDNLTRGYQLHVLLYTVHYVLNHLTGQNVDGFDMPNKLEPGMITSEMIQSASELLLRELFGDLMEEKMLTDTQKKHIKESKARKAVPIFEVFTQYIDFKGSFLDLIAPIVKILEENPSFSRIHQSEELLNKISSQLLKNPTVTGEQLLVFLYSLIERGIGMTLKVKVNDEKAARDYGEKADSQFVRKTNAQMMEESHGIQMQWVKTHQQVSSKKTEEVCGRVLANFGLQCLRKALKHKGLILIGQAGDDPSQLNKVEVKEELKEKLDPFVLLFLRAFKTFYNPLIVTTLHILVAVIHLGLPSFKQLLKKFLNKIFKLFSQASNADNEFLNTLFRCVTELIKTYAVYSDLSETQVKTLVLIIKSNVSNYSSQSHVFQCLKAIIARKFLCPDLYDLMETIEEMMVTNIQKGTRTVCANIFVQFILEYPLEKARLQAHLNHMLKNLTYFDQDGRLQLLEVFLFLVEKFPPSLLDQYTELFFFTLFLRLVNDPSKKCRAKVSLILKKLISKATSLQRQLVETTFKLGEGVQTESGKQESLLAGKLQLLQLFAECGKLQASDVSRTVAFVAGIVGKHARQASKAAQQRREETTKMAQVDELEIVNPENADFLKGIQLGDSSSDEGVQEEIKMAAYTDEEDTRWSKAYMAVTALENLFVTCEAELVVEAFPAELGGDIVTLAWRHDNFWVKLPCQRLLGHLFASCQASGNFSEVFGDVFSQKENLLKLVYQMISIFNCILMTEEMANQLVKNLVFLMGQLVDKCDNTPDDCIVKAYKKASYVGRKILGEQTDSTEPKLEGIVAFLMASMQLFYLKSAEKADNALIRATLVPILELVHRTFTDEQLPTKIRDTSSEIVDWFSTNLEKTHFIAAYHEVQQGITRGRVDRKLKERLIVGTAEGQEIKARKRLQKTQRKKEKKQDKVLQFMSYKQ